MSDDWIDDFSKRTEQEMDEIVREHDPRARSSPPYRQPAEPPAESRPIPPAPPALPPRPAWMIPTGVAAVVVIVGVAAFVFMRSGGGTSSDQTGPGPSGQSQTVATSGGASSSAASAGQSTVGTSVTIQSDQPSLPPSDSQPVPGALVLPRGQTLAAGAQAVAEESVEHWVGSSTVLTFEDGFQIYIPGDALDRNFEIHLRQFRTGSAGNTVYELSAKGEGEIRLNKPARVRLPKPGGGFDNIEISKFTAE